MASLCEVVGSPGNEAIKYEIEPQPAEQHAPEGTKAKKAEEVGTARRRSRERLVLFRMLGFDVECLGLIRGRLLPGVVTYIPVGEEARGHSAQSGDHKGRSPGTEHADQQRDDQPAKCGPQGSAAIDEDRAAAALPGGQPHRVQFAARGKDRPFGHPEPQPRQQQRAPTGRQRRQCLKGAPQDRCGGNDQSRPVPVGKPASRDLHERIGPEERTEDDALRRRVDPELLADRRHGDRQGGAVDIVDGDDQQNEQEYTPSDCGFSCEVKRSCHRCARLGKSSVRLSSGIFTSL